MRHLDEGTIHAWLDGALDAEAERKAEEHAARCTECAVMVADARGVIAAASRILTALDDVPAGVLPQGSRAMPSMPVSAAPRRWPTWTLRIAASVAVVATGTFVVMRSGVRERVAEMDQKSARTELPPGVALKVTPAITPETTPERREMPAAPAPAATPASSTATPQYSALGAQLRPQAERNIDSTAPAKRLDSGNARAADAARQLPVPAPKEAQSSTANTVVAGGAGASGAGAAPGNAPMAPAVAAAPPPRANADRVQSAPAPAESAKGTSADLEAKKDQGAPAEHAQAGKPKTEPAATPASGGRVSGLVADNLPPGMRLVSQQQTKEDAGVVERRVYELRPGVQVVLAILAPSLGGGAEARAEENAAARDSVRRKLLAAANGSDEAAGLNSIQWTDSTGAEFTLSGPIPLDSLRILRLRLPTRMQRP